MVCINTGDVCGAGRGTCDNTTCVCEEGWVSQCDFLWNNECQVHFATTKALWVTNSVLWLLVVIASVYALTRLERRTKEAMRYEVGTLVSIILAGGSCAIVGFLQVSAQTPGERSVGLDPATTGFFVVPFFLLWLFICLNPLNKAQTGVGSLAFNRVSRVRHIYLFMTPVLVLMGVIASALPIVVLYTGEQYGLDMITGFFVLQGLETVLVGSSTATTFALMYNEFSKALNSSAREIPASQRVQIERVATSAKKLVRIPTVSVLVLGPFFFVCASSALNRQVWVTLPVSTWIGAVWLLRYVNRSIKASAIVRERDREKTSQIVKPTAEIETKDSSGNAKPATDSNSSSMSSGTNKPRHAKKSRKAFRLKGFKSKPMQFMSQVTEGNSEGTVRFTQVDGVDFTNTSSNRFSRPVTLSLKLEGGSSPRAGHKSVSSLHATLWEVDIAAEGGNSDRKAFSDEEGASDKRSEHEPIM